MLETILQVIGGTFLSVGTVTALSAWLGKVWADRILESDRARYQGEIEQLKAKLTTEVESHLHVLHAQIERGQLIHRLQFEKEFQCYVVLWKRLIFARSAALGLRPAFDTYEPEKSLDEKKRERLTEFAKHVRAFKVFYLKAKPFLAPEVYEAVSELNRKLESEAISYRHGDPDRQGMDYWEQSDANADAINEHADKICDAIRQRIGIITAGEPTDLALAVH